MEASKKKKQRSKLLKLLKLLVASGNGNGNSTMSKTAQNLTSSLLTNVGPVSEGDSLVQFWPLL